jgi:hypothetical protein
VASILWAMRPPSKPSAAFPLDQALADRLKEHVLVLSQHIGERNWLRYEQLGLARDYIESQLKSFGYEVGLKEYKVRGKLCYNVEASWPGMDFSAGQEIVLVGSHYDSAPGTPGADDNASGVAMLLELARQVRGHPSARTIRFVAFSTEEAYLFSRLSMEERLSTMGSFHYAQEAKKRGDRIRGMVSLEMLGYYSTQAGSQELPTMLKILYPSQGNFALVVGNMSSAGVVWKLGREMGTASTIPVRRAVLPQFIEGVGDSDHRNFWSAGYPAVLLTDTAFYRNRHYHEPTDTHEKLDYASMAGLLPGLARAIRSLAD